MLKKCFVASVLCLASAGLIAQSSVPSGVNQTWSPDVIKVTKANYDQAVANSANKPLILYVTAWTCACCPAWESYMKKLNDADGATWTMGVVDAGPGKDTQIADKFGIKVVPQMIGFRDGKQVGLPSPIRNAEKVRNWIKEFMAGNVPEPLPENYDEISE